MLIQRLVPTLVASFLLFPVFADEAGDIANLISKGEHRNAVERADAALAQAPRDARLRFLRACGLAELGKTSEAIQAFTALTTDYPALPEPYNNLAVLYAQQGQLERARQSLQMAIQTNPAYATAHSNLADVYSRLAAQAYDKALQIDRNGAQNSPAAPKLALVRDLYSRSGGNGNVRPAAPVAPAVVASKPATPPVQIAAATSKPVVNPPAAAPVEAQRKPVDSKPVETKPADVKPVEVKPVESRPISIAAAKPNEQPATSAKGEDSKSTEEQIAKTVNGWADAWESKKVSIYLAYYGKSFKPSGLSRSAWENQRRERIESAKKIQVRVSNIKIKLDGDRATVHFVQKYRSDRLDTSTGKTLLMERAGGRWYIREERVG